MSGGGSGRDADAVLAVGSDPRAVCKDLLIEGIMSFLDEQPEEVSNQIYASWALLGELPRRLVQEWVKPNRMAAFILVANAKYAKKLHTLPAVTINMVRTILRGYLKQEFLLGLNDDLRAIESVRDRLSQKPWFASEYLADALQYLCGGHEQYNNQFDMAGSCVADMGWDGVDLVNALEAFNSDLCDALLNALQGRMVHIFTSNPDMSAEHLGQALAETNTAQRTMILQEIKDNLEEIITSTYHLGHILQFLDLDQSRIVFEAIQGSLGNMIQSTEDLNAALRMLNEGEHKRVVSQAIRAHLNTRQRAAVSTLSVFGDGHDDRDDPPTPGLS